MEGRDASEGRVRGFARRRGSRYRLRIGRSKISGTFSGALRAGAKILYIIAKYALPYELCRARMVSRSVAEG